MIREIPLTPEAQTFTITLGSVEYRITLVWREANEGGWVIDILTINDEPIIAGIPLVTGADLLAQYSYLGLCGELRVQTDNDPDEVPTFENLGDTSHVYFITE